MKFTRKLAAASSHGFTRQQGAALVVSLVIMTVMSILGITAVKKNVVQERMANSYRFGIESLNNAESGIIDALALINAGDLHVDGYDNELDPNGDGDLADTWTVTLADPNNGVFYELIMVDDDDGDGDPAVDSNEIVRLMAQGTGTSGTVRTVEVAIGTASGGTFSLQKAVLTEESIEVTGNNTLKGSVDDIHSNSDVNLQGQTNTKGEISAVGTVTGKPVGGGTAVSGAGNIYIPEIIPSDFEKYVDYKLKSDGNIYDSTDAFVANANGVEYKGWMFAGDKWIVQKENPATILAGDLYFMGKYGNVEIANNPGSNGNKWFVSILTDGYLEISGNPFFSNYKDPNDPAGFQNVLFMTGTDFLVSGNYNSDHRLQGIIAVREQVEISGNPNIHGGIIAQGAADTDGKVSGGNLLSGNATITFDGLLSPWENPALGDVTRLYWHQLNMAEGAGEFAAF